MIPSIPDFFILAVGSMKDRNLSALTEQYICRLRHEARIEVKEIRDSDRETEGKLLTSQIDRLKGYTFVLGEEGELCKSRRFSEIISAANRKIVFVIGGPDGLSSDVKKKADRLLSLSPFTFTHEIARMLLAEQLYRACTILHNRNYHRD